MGMRQVAIDLIETDLKQMLSKVGPKLHRARHWQWWC